MFKTPFNWFNKFGTLPETYKEAMSYEEQIMWLCQEIKDNENFIDEFREEFGEVDEVLTNLQEQINGNHRDIIDLQTNKQDTLTAGNGILIQNDTISTAPTYLNFLLQNGALNFNDVNIGDVFDLEPLSTANCNYLILDVNQGERIEIIGKFDTALLNNNNEVTALEKNVETSSFDDPFRWEILSKCKVVVTWYDVNTNVPDIRLFMSSDYIYDELNRKQDKLTAGNGITIQNNVISSNGGLEPINLSELINSGAYIDLSGSLGDTVNLTPVSASNTAYYIKEITPVTKFTIVGNVTVAEIDAENVIVNKSSGTGTASNPLIYDSIASLPSNARIIFSFTGTDSISPSIYYDIDSISINNSFADMKAIHKFRQDLYLDNSSPDTTLIDGLYFTDKYHVYINDNISYQFDNALILVNGSRLCVIASPSNNTNHLMYYQVYYDNNQWNYGFMHPSTTWSQVSDKPAGMENYSTSEQVVGTWIDGKPVYRKTFTATTTSSNNIVLIQVADGCPTNVETIIHSYGSVASPSANFVWTVPYYAGSNDKANIIFHAEENGNPPSLELQSGSSFGYGSFVATIEYTKTTD